MLILEMWLKTKLHSRLSPWKYLWMPKEPALHPALWHIFYILHVPLRLKDWRETSTEETSVHPCSQHLWQSSSYITLSRSFFCIRDIFQDVPLRSLSSRRISHIRMLALFFPFNLCTCAICRDIKIQRVLSRLFVSQLALIRCPPANKHLQLPVITRSSSTTAITLRHFISFLQRPLYSKSS